MKMHTICLLALALSGLPVFGQTTWSGSYTSQTTITVPESAHGINSPYLAMYAVTSTGALLSQWSDYTAWVTNGANDVEFDFNAAFTGTVYVTGAWPSSDTYPTYGFIPTISGPGNRVFGINGNCSPTTLCQETMGEVPYVANDMSYIHWPVGAPAGTTHVFMYMRYGIVRFGVNASSLPSGAGVYNAALDLNVSSMPADSDAVPLADAYVTATGSSASFGSLNTYALPDKGCCSPPPPNNVPEPIIIIFDGD